MSAPIRSYLTTNRGNFPQVAFYITLDGRPGETLRNMEKVAGKARWPLSCSTPLRSRRITIRKRWRGSASRSFQQLRDPWKM